ncbi:hypothetical protein BpHYR1_033388 [Brachionus plicatilis]|uniref:Uncharacterized protein n=1 Tax=Brachionus plicatilis TaxID=10195 RepID=A0A3M7PAG2_BRAPC|nr:hypothetical protein BpHYR1_033388 [Brachionus plicatilis]
MDLIHLKIIDQHFILIQLFLINEIIIGQNLKFSKLLGSRASLTKKRHGKLKLSLTIINFVLRKISPIFLSMIINLQKNDLEIFVKWSLLKIKFVNNLNFVELITISYT